MVAYYPNVLSHTDNYILADPLVTPSHIVPEWYLLSFYAILRSIPSKFGGVLYMGGSILILFLLPILGNNIITTVLWRPYYSIFIYLFIYNFILLA
jgi:ubiquinol-cytochrome c reductase cytochrome b subunit